MRTRWIMVAMKQGSDERWARRRRCLPCLPMERLEGRGLLSAGGAVRPAHLVDLPDRLREGAYLSAATTRQAVHAEGSDGGSDPAGRAAHPPGETAATAPAARGGGGRRAAPDTVATRALLESISSARGPSDPTTADGLVEPVPESFGTGGSSVEPAEVPGLGKDGFEAAPALTSAGIATGPSSGTVGRSAPTPTPKSAPVAMAGRVQAQTGPGPVADPEHAMGEIRAWTVARVDGPRLLATISDRVDAATAEGSDRVEPLEGGAPTEWEAIDREMRRFLADAGLPGIREVHRAGLAWLPWVGAAAGLYLAHRAAVGRRRLFRRDGARSRRLVTGPLPVGPWPLNSP